MVWFIVDFILIQAYTFPSIRLSRPFNPCQDLRLEIDAGASSDALHSPRPQDTGWLLCRRIH